MSNNDTVADGVENLNADDDFEFSTTNTVWSTAFQSMKGRNGGRGRRQAYGSRNTCSTSSYHRSLSVPQLDRHSESQLTSYSSQEVSQLQPPLRKRVLRRTASANVTSSSTIKTYTERNALGTSKSSKDFTLLQDERPFIFDDDFDNEVNENIHPNTNCLDLSDDQIVQNLESTALSLRLRKITRSQSADMQCRHQKKNNEMEKTGKKPHKSSTSIRQRSISPAFSLNGSLSGGETFADLAAITEDFSKEPVSSTDDIVDEALTPPYAGLSLSQQSRKRSNIGSPVLDLDEGELTREDYFESLVTTAAPTFDSLGRCRSRSRIFSPEFIQKAVIDSPFNDHASQSSNTVETAADPFNDMRCSIGSDSPHDVSCSTHDDDSESDDDFKEKRTCDSNKLQVPPLPHRLPSLETQSSSSSITPTFETHTVSSQALKYMYKSLHKSTKASLSQRPSRISTKIFTDSKTVTVFPPKDWSNESSASFMNWAAGSLGFQVLSLGGNMGVFLQANIEQGKAAYLSVRNELLSRKDTTRQNFKERNQLVCSSPSPMNISTMKEENRGPIMMSIEKPLRSNSKKVDYFESDLLSEMKGLSLSQSKAPLDDIHTSPAILSEHSIDQFRNNAGRMSTDSFVHGGQDYIQSMCFGGSPNTVNDHTIRPPQLVLASKEEQEFNKNLYNPLSGDFRSPFSMSQPATTCVSSSKGNSFAPTSMTIAETPIPKSVENWGSRPIPDRHWASSDYCTSEVLEPLFLILDKYPDEYDHTGKVNITLCMSPTYSSSLFMNSAIAETAASSSDLGLDIEQSDKEIRFCVMEDESNTLKKQRASFAKHKRMSLCSTVQSRYSLNYTDNLNRKSVCALTKRRSVIFTPILEQPSNHQEENIFNNSSILFRILSYFTEPELICSISLVSTYWYEISSRAQATLMLVSVGCSTSAMIPDENTKSNCSDVLLESTKDDVSIEETISSKIDTTSSSSVSKSMEWEWKQLIANFPWGCFLSQGAFKKVYRVMNVNVMAEEAISVMNVDEIDSCGNKTVVGTELAVSSLLSSLVRRGVCPNFVSTRRVFTCSYEPPASLWGDETNKCPQGKIFNQKDKRRKPRKPNDSKIGRYQYIRMELCHYGDAEEFLKDQPNKVIRAKEARHLLFQMAFSLYVASDRFCLKHYDVKLLNFFLQDMHASVNDVDALSSKSPYTCLRYGLGNHVYLLRMPTSRTIVAKLADYGTATFGMSQDHLSEVTIGQFTTVENTPPEQFILGDAALQGHGHDNFGLGLCMLHLFTGHCPYEEILSDVLCPPSLRNSLEKIWEVDHVPRLKGKRRNNHNTYSVLRSLIKIDSADGEIYDVPYHTLYRFLVLFGIPDDKFGITRENGKYGGSKKVWDAITSCLLPSDDLMSEGDKENQLVRSHRSIGWNKNKNSKPQNAATEDSILFEKDRMKYSIDYGSNPLIKNARRKLSGIDGGIQLLKGLVEFNPDKRLTSLEVLNSTFMSALREDHVSVSVQDNDLVYSYMSYAISHRGSM